MEAIRRNSRRNYWLGAFLAFRYHGPKPSSCLTTACLSPETIVGKGTLHFFSIIACSIPGYAPSYMIVFFSRSGSFQHSFSTSEIFGWRFAFLTPPWTWRWLSKALSVFFLTPVVESDGFFKFYLWHLVHTIRRRSKPYSRSNTIRYCSPRRTINRSGVRN